MFFHSRLNLTVKSNNHYLTTLLTKSNNNNNNNKKHAIAFLKVQCQDLIDTNDICTNIFQNQQW